MWLSLALGAAVVVLLLSSGAFASVPVPTTTTDNASFSGTNPLVIGGGMGTIEQLAQAIATAEGYFKHGSLPERIHNPGDLKLGDRGYGTEGGKTIFPNDVAGWNALYHELELIVSGSSSYYRTDMTLREIALVWTGNDNPDQWAAAVASYMGVTSGMVLSDVISV